MQTIIQYPEIGSLIHIDPSAELISNCPNKGSIAIVADENTYGIVLSHNLIEHGVSVEVMIGTQSWSILHKYTLQDREFGYWPFRVIE